MGKVVLTGGVCWQKKGDMSSLPLLHLTCCELTQPGHTGPSRTAVTGEMTTATGLLFMKLAVLSQLNLNKYTLLIPVGKLSFCLPPFQVRSHGLLQISVVGIHMVSSSPSYTLLSEITNLLNVLNDIE